MSDSKSQAEGADVGKFLREAAPEAETVIPPEPSAPRDRVPARVSFVTLAVRDMAAMTRFYRQFRWPESQHSDESFVAFRTGGAVLGLFPCQKLREGARCRHESGRLQGICARDQSREPLVRRSRFLVPRS